MVLRDALLCFVEEFWYVRCNGVPGYRDPYCAWEIPIRVSISHPPSFPLLPVRESIQTGQPLSAHAQSLFVLSFFFLFLKDAGVDLALLVFMYTVLVLVASFFIAFFDCSLVLLYCTNESNRI